MSRFIRMLQNGPVLIYSLPRNDPAFAMAAIAGGAEVLKAHLNVAHHASGTHFGNFKEERPALIEIMRLAHTKDVPVGIVPGEEKRATLAELREMLEMGVDFFDIDSRYLDEELLSFPMGRVTAITDLYQLDDVRIRAKALRSDAVEASLIRESSYGEEMDDFHLLRYKMFCEKVRKLHPDKILPVIIPSQLRLTPLSVKALLTLTPKIIMGIMLGAIVTGSSEPRAIRERLLPYRLIINAAKEGRL